MLENLWPHGTHGNRAWATFFYIRLKTTSRKALARGPEPIESDLRISNIEPSYAWKKAANDIRLWT